MRLWSNGADDGDVLLVGNRGDIATLMGIPAEEVMLYQKQPVDDLIDEVGERQVRALIRLLVKVIRPAAFQDDWLQTLRPRGTWRVIEDQTYIFIVVDGERVAKTVEELIANVVDPIILADRIDGHWVMR